MSTKNDLSQASSLQTVSEAITNVVRKVSPSVVQIRSGGRGFGSGIVWSNEGHILTNSHVVGRASEVNVTLSSSSFEGDRSFKANLVGQDRFSDVALLKIEGAEAGNLHPIERGVSPGASNLEVGQFVLALANPFGGKVSATFGIITNASARMGGHMPWADNVIVTDARLNPGYSGGPLVNALGQMIGMSTAYFANRGIAIPIDSLGEISKSLASEGNVKRAYLGIVSDSIDLPKEVAEEIEQSEGLIVLSVESGTPAKKGGVAVGDIVVRLDSKPVRSYYDLRKLLTSKVIGKPTSLSVLRGEKLTELTVTPIEA